MIYKLNENRVLLETTISLNKSANRDCKNYKLNFYSGSEGRKLKHGPRVKIYENSSHVATYAIDRNSGDIAIIGDNKINKNNIRDIDLVIREISYGCLPLILKTLQNASSSDKDILEYYANIIASGNRTTIHNIAMTVRNEINDKILR